MPPPGSEALPNCTSPTSIMVQSLQPPSTLPSAQRCHPHWRKETCLAQKVGFSPPSQPGNCFGFLARQLRRKRPPGLKSVIHTGQPKQPPAVILFPSLLNILEKGVPNPSLLGPWHPELNDWSVRQAKACSQGSWPPKTPKKERKSG